MSENTPRTAPAPISGTGRPALDLGAIRRTLKQGDPVFPALILELVERCEKAEANAASFQRLATQHLARRLVDKIDYEVLLDAARAWRGVTGFMRRKSACWRRLRGVICNNACLSYASHNHAAAGE